MIPVVSSHTEDESLYCYLLSLVISRMSLYIDTCCLLSYRGSVSILISVETNHTEDDSLY